jgi:GAF domain-containing protein
MMLNEPKPASSPALKSLRQQSELLSTVTTFLASRLPAEAVEKLRSIEAELGSVHTQLSAESVEVSQLRALASTWEIVNSSLDLNVVLAQAMEQVIQLTGAERGYILWKKPNTDTLEYHVASSLEQDPTDSNFEISHTIVNKVMTSGQPLLTANASDDANIGGSASIMHFAMRSVLCVPLKRRDDTVYGVVYAANRLRVGLFTERDLWLLNAYANLASMAIENARVFTRVKTELQQAREEVERLRVEINQEKLEKQVSDITETQYFRQLQERARAMRRGETGGLAEAKNEGES